MGSDGPLSALLDLGDPLRNPGGCRQASPCPFFLRLPSCGSGFLRELRKCTETRGPHHPLRRRCYMGTGT